MEELDVATRQRQINILQCLVSKDDDEIIWTLSMNKDIMKKDIGFGKHKWFFSYNLALVDKEFVH